jgi:hypothetical protein
MSKNHHSVYVIELAPDILGDKDFLDANPGMDREKPCYYVGLTGISITDRFKNHKRGYKSCKYVKDHGLALVPELYEQYNPMSWEMAVTMEKLLALVLRQKGHGVWQK